MAKVLSEDAIAQYGRGKMQEAVDDFTAAIGAKADYVAPPVARAPRPSSSITPIPAVKITTSSPRVS